MRNMTAIRAEEPLWLTFVLCVAIALLGVALIRFRHAFVRFEKRHRPQLAGRLTRASPTYERFARPALYFMLWVVGISWIAGGLFGVVLVVFGPLGD